jgi:hypothetical protein
VHPLVAIGIGACAGTMAPADMALLIAGYAVGRMRGRGTRAA